LSLWDWFISFNMMISSSTHFPANNIILFHYVKDLYSSKNHYLPLQNKYPWIHLNSVPPQRLQFGGHSFNIHITSRLHEWLHCLLLHHLLVTHAKITPARYGQEKTQAFNLEANTLLSKGS
jgi:hypothetical protein